MSHDPMPTRFVELAEYNSAMDTTRITPAPEYGPGVWHVSELPPPMVFDPAYTARMEALQNDFNAWQRERDERMGEVVDLPGGGRMIFPRPI